MAIRFKAAGSAPIYSMAASDRIIPLLPPYYYYYEKEPRVRALIEAEPQQSSFLY